MNPDLTLRLHDGEPVLVPQTTPGRDALAQIAAHAPSGVTLGHDGYGRGAYDRLCEAARHVGDYGLVVIGDLPERFRHRRRPIDFPGSSHPAPTPHAMPVPYQRESDPMFNEPTPNCEVCGGNVGRCSAAPLSLPRMPGVRRSRGPRMLRARLVTCRRNGEPACTVTGAAAGVCATAGTRARCGTPYLASFETRPDDFRRPRPPHPGPRRTSPRPAGTPAPSAAGPLFHTPEGHPVQRLGRSFSPRTCRPSTTPPLMPADRPAAPAWESDPDCPNRGFRAPHPAGDGRFVRYWTDDFRRERLGLQAVWDRGWTYGMGNSPGGSIGHSEESAKIAAESLWRRERGRLLADRQGKGGVRPGPAIPPRMGSPKRSRAASGSAGGPP